MAGITQSLACRVRRVELLPLSGSELGPDRLPETLDAMLFSGGYPALSGRPLAPTDWFPNYVATYLERDVRQLLAVQDSSQFHRFVRACAARSGQLPNLAALGVDCGISVVTAAKWLSVLETPQGLQAIEIKSGSTFASDWPQAVRKWIGMADTPTHMSIIIFGGTGSYARQDCSVMG